VGFGAFEKVFKSHFHLRNLILKFSETLPFCQFWGEFVPSVATIKSTSLSQMVNSERLAL